MRELYIEETTSVAAAGAPILLAVLAFEWYNLDKIEDFVEGFFDGLSD